MVDNPPPSDGDSGASKQHVTAHAGRRLPASGPQDMAIYPAANPGFVKAQSPKFLPFWTIGLMLLIVLFSAAFILAIVVLARGTRWVSVDEPVIKIITAEPAPEAIPRASANSEVESAVTDTGVQVVIAADAPESLDVAGPVLPTVAITPTPKPLAIGFSAVVVDVGNQELNIRNLPGLINSQILFRAPEGSLFEIIEGPQEADGFTWWKVLDTQFQIEGWAVANYLQVIE